MRTHFGWLLGVLALSCSSRSEQSDRVTGAGGGASNTQTKTIAHQGWWRGWFEDTLNDHFEFRVAGDNIYDSYFAAAKANSMCTVMTIGYGVQLDAAIVDNAFDYSLGGLSFVGNFVDAVHAKVRFPNADTSACDIQRYQSYDVYYVEDSCAPNVPEITGLSGGVTGGSSTITLKCSAVLPSGCSTGVKEGATIHISVDDLDGTGTTMEQADVSLVSGAATAKVLFGNMPGKFQLVVQVEGVAPSVRTKSVTLTQSTQHDADAGTPHSVCGDGVLASSEACDDGGPLSGDGCSATCQIEPGWICPTAGEPCQKLAKCGDGVLRSSETCDDGNLAADDGCTATCRLESGYKCSGQPSVCTRTACGDSTIEGTEGCDDGNTASGDGCSMDCQVEPSCAGTICASRCGDGIVVSEECDDGNRLDGDGCSGACKLELGWTCTPLPSAVMDNMMSTQCQTTCGDGDVVGAEECDDLGASGVCSAQCKWVN